jgi:hypothetical protein
MTRPFADFDRIISAKLLAFGDRVERSTYREPKREPREEGCAEEFWREGARTKAHWHSKRTAAYLAAYVDFAGSAHLPARGLSTDDGYVWLDKGVMCSLLVGRCVEFVNEGGFELTEKGQALIAPFVPPSRYEGATA